MRPALNRFLLLALLLGSSSLWSQSPQTVESMPAWTVLTLKLVSSTHVQPTTGIVIAAPDLVLVAMDFAREGDEILVLDGGTDIVRHGRPARIIHTLPADKLAILRVLGLNRPAARLSALSEAELKTLNLVAFPPAEMIAQGSAPVRSSVKALPAITSTHPTLDPFPNVSGALTDNCGNLVAFNLADGVQSMQPSSSPRLAWPDALKRAADLTGAALAVAPCDVANVQTAAVPPQADGKEPPKPTADPPVDPEPLAEKVPENPPENEPAASEPEVLEQAVEQAEAEAAEGGVDSEPDLAEAELLAEAEDEAEGEPLAAESESMEKATTEASSGGLQKLVILVLLLLAAFFAWRIYRQRSVKNSSAGASSASGLQQASIAETGPSEPETVRFGADTDQPSLICLQLQGQLSDGESFTREFPVDGPDWQAEIGRQDADIVLASSLLSRRHAKVQIHDGRISISDLGSTNGTRLNEVPCLPGETFLVQAGDVLQLGDVKFTLQLTTGAD